VSSSIEEQFQPPEWATKDEVIKAAQHYINYWKIEARHRNQQWLDAMAENARLKAEVERLKEGNECLDQMHEKEMARSAFLCEEVNRTTDWGRGLESDLSWARAELLMVKAELERVRLIAHDNKQALYNAKAEVDRLTDEYNRLFIHCDALERDIDEGKKS
jgi:chromosome segregation ATPase